MEKLADRHPMRKEITLVKYLKRTLGPKKEEWREEICYDVLKELETMF